MLSPSSFQLGQHVRRYIDIGGDCLSIAVLLVVFLLIFLLVLLLILVVGVVVLRVASTFRSSVPVYLILLAFLVGI